MKSKKHYVHPHEVDYEVGDFVIEKKYPFGVYRVKEFSLAYAHEFEIDKNEPQPPPEFWMAEVHPVLTKPTGRARITISCLKKAPDIVRELYEE